MAIIWLCSLHSNEMRFSSIRSIGMTVHAHHPLKVLELNLFILTVLSMSGVFTSGSYSNDVE